MIRPTYRPRRALVWLVALAGVVSACDRKPPPDPWPEAQALFARNDPHAYDAWADLPEESAGAEEARRRLRAADPHYRDGVRLLAAGDDEAAYDAIVEGLAQGPMDPVYYPVLGRIYVERGNDAEAARFFERYLRARPMAEDSARVRRELATLSPGATILTEPIALEEPQIETLPPVVPLWGWVTLGVIAGLSLALAGVWIVRTLRRRGVSLARIVREQPELHPAIAMLVGSLRHELLKHRVGAARDALSLLETGRVSGDQRAFLRARLLGGDAESTPLDRAFDAYLRAFERALGGRFDAYGDRNFRAARRAIRTIVTWTPKLDEEPGKRALRKLREAHDHLTDFDRYLKSLVDGLIRTEVNDELLDQVLSEVREEYAAGLVPLDELDAVVEEPAAIEVFRVDLMLVLKNVVRNAILAVGRDEGPRRVELRTRSTLEVTGEETVHFVVSDSSSEILTLEAIRDREIGRGLGLVRAAVDRYGGAITIEAGEGGFEKSVVVSFPRAYD